jgi:hypothetical protein
MSASHPGEDRWPCPANRQIGDSHHFFPTTATTRRSLTKALTLFINKESPMQYKTIIVEMLEQRPRMREELRQSRKLLSTMERFATELKSSHEAWKERLQQSRPESDPSQIASEAMELALKDMEDRLPSESAQDESEALSLDGAMAHLARHSSRD